jgi:hypothetical protein
MDAWQVVVTFGVKRVAAVLGFIYCYKIDTRRVYTTLAVQVVYEC